MSASIDFLAAPGTGTLLADAGSRGLFRSSNGGESWERVNLRDPFNLVATDAKDPNLIYAYASANRRLYKSTDGGSSWSVTPVDLSGRYLWGALAIAPGQESTLYAVASYQYTQNVIFNPPQDFIFIRSTDSGGTWAVINKVLGVGFSQLVFDPRNPNTLYALGSDSCENPFPELGYCNAVLKSTDGGASWSLSFSQAQASPAFMFGITELVLNPDNPGTLYVALSDRRVMKTTDGGLTWNTTGLSSRPILEYGYDNNLVLDPSAPETLYVGFGNSVYRSPDGGLSWEEINGGLPTDLAIRSLAIDPSGTSLHVSTRRGVFDYHLTPACAAPLSPTQQSFDASGGAAVVEVIAGDCSWTAESNVDWIRVTSGGSGSGKGTVSFIVTPNNSTAPRSGGLSIGGRVLKVTQAGLSVRIIGANAAGKKLIVDGENFDPGAIILLNGEAQITKNDPQNPRARLIGKRSGKKIKLGDRVQVRNPNGSLSDEFIYTAGSEGPRQNGQGL
jgi:photosystem II stability/assembly factor-like uncharacterized protein